MRLIGIDPGLQRTGWGVLAVDGSRLSHVGHGVIVSDTKRPLAERLRQLYEAGPCRQSCESGLCL